MAKVNFLAIEKKWQKEWEQGKVFEVNADSAKRKYYVLEMYPYPSGSGLHMGHAFNYTIGDIQARFKRMQGLNVLYPMGYDSFGLPAENAAIKVKKHPRKFTEDSIKNFVKQQSGLGLSYDWSRMIRSHDPQFYKWNQLFFLRLLGKGLVYRGKAGVNWCSKCKTVLANEQVHNGKCWRHKENEVEIRELEQWFINTTSYADELLRDIEKLDWPERIKIMQRNWIGKSIGSEILFEIEGKKWPVFTTRADTLFGVAFMVISAGHPKLMSLVKDKYRKDVERFLKCIRSTKQEAMDKIDKEGVFTGSYAVNPINGNEVPVYVGNFVIADYGSGMVMAVPAHDQRDFEFAKKYKINFKKVIEPIEGNNKKLKEAFTGYGKLVNSEGFDGLKSEEAKEHITNALQMNKLGRKTVQYKLRDWLVSRQRYWGTPIPIIYCDKCGILPVPESELPVKLPERVKFGKGNPLESSKDFVNAKCHKCGGKCRRETDTMDTFFDSSWYYLRYIDSKNEGRPFDKEKAEYWMPVDQYIGGAEHAVMHLIYARFFTKALRDLGYLKIDEPFPRLFNQGMLHGSDGAVMSKSRGNVVNPMDVVGKYGADSLRLFLVSVASPDKDFNWSDKGIEGSWKFIMRVWDFFKRVKLGKSSPKMESKLNKSILGISKDIAGFRYNLAVIKLRKLFDSFVNEEKGKEDLNKFLKMFSVFCPHVAEELWSGLGNKGFVSLAEWPSSDSGKIDEKFDKLDEVVEKVVGDILNVLKIVKGKKVYLYVIPGEVENYSAEELSRRVGVSVEVFASNDPGKVDPGKKAGKAKPGRPGIFVE